MKKLFIALFILGLPGAALAEPMVEDHNSADIFYGTIENKGDKLILKRCDVGTHEYVLLNSPTTKTPMLDNMKKIKFKNPTTIMIVGHYTETPADKGLSNAMVSALEVIDYDEIKEGVSCHLLDAVNDAFPEPAINKPH